MKISKLGIAAFILLAAAAFFVTMLNMEFEQKSIEVRESTQGQMLSGRNGLNEGDTPPDFTILTADGKNITLSDFARENKPVLVYFMATWCPYCAADYAALSKVYKEYEDKIVVLSISLDLSEDAGLLSDYKKKYPALEKMIIAPGQAKILNDYKVIATTTKYALDKNGKIIFAGKGELEAEDWKILLEEMLK